MKIKTVSWVYSLLVKILKKNLSPEGLDVLKNIVDKEKLIDYKNLNMQPSSKNKFDFRMFVVLEPFFSQSFMEKF